MVDQFATELKSSISEHRLERYRRPTDAEDLDMLINYFWNMALTDALHCSLSAAEILLRNTIHKTLSGYFGNETNCWKRSNARTATTPNTTSRHAAGRLHLSGSYPN